MLFGKDKRSRTEQELRAARPRAPRQLLDQLTAQATPARRGRSGYRSAGARLAVLGIAIVALAAVGGIGFAASTAFTTTKVKVQKVATGGAKSVSVTQAVRNAARDQYDNGVRSTADGAPEIVVAGGTEAPVSGAVKKGKTDVVLTTSITPNESGTLAIRVLNSQDVALKMNGASTTVDGEAVGQAQDSVYRKVINQPRKLKVVISIPGTLVEDNEDLDIKLTYTDFDASHKRTAITIPATAPDRPAVKKTFKLTQEDLKQIQGEAADDGLYSVSFNVAVRGTDPVVKISWEGTTVTEKTVGPLDFDADDEDEPGAAVVTVDNGGVITSGDFKILKPVPAPPSKEKCSVSIQSFAQNGDVVTVRGSTTCSSAALKVRQISKPSARTRVKELQRTTIRKGGFTFSVPVATGAETASVRVRANAQSEGRKSGKVLAVEKTDLG